jgi:hypothetical protein
MTGFGIGTKSRSGFTLAIHDATVLEYTNRKSLNDDLGQIGNGFRRAFIAQISLLVCLETGAALGLVNQHLHRRPRVKKEKLAANDRNGSPEKACFGSKESSHCQQIARSSMFAIGAQTLRS